MSTFVQFDGEITETKTLLDELKQKGIKVIAVHRSRWRTENGEDKGGRIDIEIEDEIEPVKNKVVHLEQAMKDNTTWKKKVVEKIT